MIKGAFFTFHKDADQIYPGRKEKLGYIGESSVQAATFDSKKEATAAAILGTLYANHPKITSKYWADVGDFYYGTANNKSGNAMNYPETIGPDSHVDGPALPVSTYEADVGYFVDSTAINAAGKHYLPEAFAREARGRISLASSQVCRGCWLLRLWQRFEPGLSISGLALCRLHSESRADAFIYHLSRYVCDHLDFVSRDCCSLRRGVFLKNECERLRHR